MIMNRRCVRVDGCEKSSSMSGPPQGTLWIDLLPLNNPDYVIGIDTAFFNVNAVFKGLKVIPAGLHLFHYADGDMRAGKWFEFHDNQVISIYWDCEKEQFLQKTPDMDRVASEYHLMVLYPEDLEVWTSLTRHIKMPNIQAIGPSEPITTATPLKEENMVLERTLKSKDPNQVLLDQASEELSYTIVLFKETEGNSDEQKTKNALDRSWQLHQLYSSKRLLLSELQMSFVYFCVLGNLCSCTQWTTLLRLVLLSEAFLHENTEVANYFLELFLAQLKKIPEEYVGTTELGVVDIKEFTGIFERLGSIFQNSRWYAIEAVCQSRFGFLIKNLQAKFDADNYEIYDLNDHDEEDEDAPALV